ncbi:ABC transporter permease subunit [Candidatus Chloroploca asiatica]|uniref:Uncharacterized protein n=1 Tax=Candidatus Chloroploca asiatica TaxID=1506545 RepID=A0A2H3L3H6_9CHLR|nr:ABC transporter permease subunit [Candidatus Chloroploca asiatica]PDV96780.1 hypothetical protein A9Q02_06040 [Candidatus Chloroploca asiatica]
MFTRLFAAEWLKLWRRPLAWAMLAIFLGLLALSLILWTLVVALHEGVLGINLTVLRDEQVAEIRRQLSLPGIFGMVLGQVNSTGGILAILLAAGSLGGDYSWGTLRSLLSRAPDRRAYLLAKTMALLLGLLIGIVLGLLVGVLIALIASAWLGLPHTLSVRDLLVLPIGIARALLIILPYLLLTLASAALGRSTLAGIAGGIVFLIFDIGAGSLTSLGLVNPLIRQVINLLLQPNINSLVMQNGQLFGLDQSLLTNALDPTVLPAPFQATLVVIIYSLLFGYTAWRTIARRDITGAQ